MTTRARVVRFRGRTRNGIASGGCIETSDVASFVESQYRAGWRVLTVVLDGQDPEIEVGGIAPNGPGGSRTWWAEQ